MENGLTFSFNAVIGKLYLIQGNITLSLKSLQLDRNSGITWTKFLPEDLGSKKSIDVNRV